MIDGSGLAAEKQRRLAVLDDMREHGRNPYPYRFDRTHTLAELRAGWGELEPGVETDDEVTVAGRIMLKRDSGKLVFATIRDRTGDVQLFISKAVVGDGPFADIKALDLGDWVGVSGTVMTTRKGELSVKPVGEAGVALLSKAVRPMPDKWHGLSDVDTRFRQRYPEVGGAHARPFTTHHNALDMPLYLRIAVELYLKRLIVGGMERVYEIARTFRNEGVSTRHNPEFTMMELYQAFGDWTDVMDITEELVTTAARDALGTTVIEIRGEQVDLADPWPRTRMIDAASEGTGVELHPSMPIADARRVAADHDVFVESYWGTGKIIEELFEKTSESSIMRPTFVTGHPVEISPLARVDRDDPYLTERFELFVDGREIANGYSELNDPVEQRMRFEAEQVAKEAGNDEAGTVDEDYLRALEYGMPPTGGLGIGIDRLAMLLAGVDSIKEVILFPTLRPEA